MGFRFDNKFNLGDDGNVNDYVEGIEGIVKITPGFEQEQFYSLPVKNSSPLNEIDDNIHSPMKDVVDLHSIQIDTLELNEISKNPNIYEIENS